jgi:hypothetical protein
MAHLEAWRVALDSSSSEYLFLEDDVSFVPAATTTTNPVAPTPAPVPAPLGHQRTVSETATTHPHGIRIISSK